jgi:hypothetical protein
VFLIKADGLGQSEPAFDRVMEIREIRDDSTPPYFVYQRRDGHWECLETFPPQKFNQHSADRATSVLCFRTDQSVSEMKTL